MPLSNEEITQPLYAPSPTKAIELLLDDAQSERIVAALAEQGWGVISDFIPEAFGSALRQALTLHRCNGDFQPARLGQGGGLTAGKEVRSDEIMWLDRNNRIPIDDYLAYIGDIQQLLNCQLSLGLESYESIATIFPVGSACKRHLDQINNHEQRILTAILYLNQEWQTEDGGQLRLYTGSGDEHIDIYPQAGNLLIFLSPRFQHEVLPTNRKRLAITTWFKRREGRQPEPTF